MEQRSPRRYLSESETAFVEGWILEQGLMFYEALRRMMVPVSCPRCEYVTDIGVRELELEGMVLCAGCHATIRFVDDGFSVRSAFRASRWVDREMERILGSL